MGFSTETGSDLKKISRNLVHCCVHSAHVPDQNRRAVCDTDVRFMETFRFPRLAATVLSSRLVQPNYQMLLFSFPLFSFLSFFFFSVSAVDPVNSECKTEADFICRLAIG